MKPDPNTAYKKIYRVMLIILLLMMLPVWYLCRYQILNLDDFYFGTMTHQAWITTHSVGAVISAACEQVRFYFFEKQATYSSVFLMSAFPGVWHENMYFPVSFIMSCMILGSVWALVHVIIGDCMGVKDKYLCGIAAIILGFTVIETLPVPLEALFWYNGSLHYVFMESLLFFEAAIILHGMHSDVKRTRVGMIIAASLIGAIVGGGNLITGLQACILVGLHILLYICGIFSEKKDTSIFRRMGIAGSDKCDLWFLIPEAVTIAGYMVNILAPGNAKRQDPDMMMSPVKAVIMSFYRGAEHAVSWLNPVTIIGLILIALIVGALAARSKAHFLHPLLMALISICVFAAMFTPTFYAMAQDAPNRIVNIIYIAEYVIIFINIVNAEGYLYTRPEGAAGSAEGSEAGMAAGGFMRGLLDLCAGSLHGILIAGGVAILILVTVSADKNEYVTISAVRSIANGEAARYHEQSVERLAILSDESKRDVTITAYTDDAKPYLLLKEDVGNAPGEVGYWQNVELSHYFDKDSITVVSP